MTADGWVLPDMRYQRLKQSARIQIITTNYSTYLQQFYVQRPELASQSYADQQAALMSDYFGVTGSWSVALGRLGYVASQVVANAEPMQKRWALENGLTYDATNWLLQITTAQVKAFQPDILFVNDYSTFTAPFLRQLKSECPAIRLVLGWCGAPYGDPSVFREYDIVLSNIPELVEHFRENGHRCYHLNHAFDPHILEHIDTKASPSVDFAFLGSIVKRGKYHNEREKLLLELVQKTNLQIWSEIRRPSAKQHLSTALRQLAYDAVHIAQRVGVPQPLLAAVPLVQKVARWDARPGFSQYVDDRIARHAHPPLFGLSMFQQLHDSKVALNTHIDISPISASNVRLYEVTGVGACLLTDWKVNLSDLFAPEVEVVTYRNAEECIEKVRYLLDHEDERQAIAAAGQRRTLREHTYAQRVAQLNEIILDALGK